MSRLSRRQAVQAAGVVGLGLVAGCGRLPWQTASPPRVYRVGYVGSGSPSANVPNVDSLRQGLHDYGYVEGQNLELETRFADGVTESLPALVDELLQLPVDVLVVTSGATIRTAQEATRTVPIVVARGGDLVQAGYIASLARPGGNLTGMSTPLVGLSAKRLQLLKETVPAVTRVAVPWNMASPSLALDFADAEQAAHRLGVQLISLDLSGSGLDLNAVIEGAVAERTDGLLGLEDSAIGTNAQRIGSLASRYRLPAISPYPALATAGGLMSYGHSSSALFHRASYFVDRVLKGTNPTDLPVEQPREFEFVINLRTAQVLGLTIPHHILLQATEVIQ
jgi:putative tryptophan/tyrosine transport system substrate-binding protein